MIKFIKFVKIERELILGYHLLKQRQLPSRLHFFFSFNTKIENGKIGMKKKKSFMMKVDSLYYEKKYR